MYMYLRNLEEETGEGLRKKTRKGKRGRKLGKGNSKFEETGENWGRKLSTCQSPTQKKPH
jgi:hypothetical protein